MDLSDLRGYYTSQGIDPQALAEQPVDQFDLWFAQAREAGLIEPNAMALATVNAQGIPSLRSVLLKIYDKQGFVFFTNYNSDKAEEIEHNPNVALLFMWLGLERQVKIIGTAEKISTKESLAYFMKRPRGSQIGAWVSDQSSVISSRKMLELKFGEMLKKFQGQDVPLPHFWGGYRVVPHTVEFWQGRENRLHDRYVYKLQTEGRWSIEQLAP